VQRRLFLLASAAALAACGRAAPRYAGVDLTGAPYGRDFRLQDDGGTERSLADYRGRYVLLFFGFTQCPDVCPTALARAAAAKRLLGTDGERLAVLFVTIDPARDSAAVLREYARAFDPSFTGLRGDLATTERTVSDFHAFYRKVPTGAGYTMDHSTFTYVFDPAGRLRLALRHEQSAEEVASDLRTLMQSFSSSPT